MCKLKRFPSSITFSFVVVVALLTSCSAPGSTTPRSTQPPTASTSRIRQISSEDLISLYEQLEQRGLVNPVTAKPDELKQLWTAVNDPLNIADKPASARQYLILAGQLRQMRDGTHDPNNGVPNACRSKSHTIPFTVGAPSWWFLLSFNTDPGENSDTAFYACMVLYDLQWNNPVVVAVPCKPLPLSETPALTEGQTITLTPTATSEEPKTIVDYKAKFQGGLSCENNPSVTGAQMPPGESLSYDEFWIKVVGTLQPNGSSTTKPLFGYTAGSPLSRITLDVKKGPTNKSLLETNFNDKKYRGDNEFDPEADTTLGSFFKAASLITETTVFTHWVQIPSSFGVQEQPLAQGTQPPTNVQFYPGGKFYIGANPDEDLRLNGEILDELIADPGPGRGGV